MKINFILIFALLFSLNGYTQNVYTIAGTGNAGYTGDGGQAIVADIDTPYGICADDNGNIYFVDQGNAVIRKIDNSGNITTLISSADIPNFTPNTVEHYNGTLYFVNYITTGGSTIYKYELSTSLLSSVYTSPSTTTYYNDLAVVNNDSIFLSKQVGSYYEIDLLTGITTTVALFTGYSSSSSNQFQYNYSIISDMLILNPGQLLVLHTNSSGSFGEVLGIDFGSGIGSVDALTLSSNPLIFPEGFTSNAQGDVFICDRLANKIYKLLTDGSGTLTDYAGTGTAGYTDDVASLAEFDNPAKIVSYGLGELLISDMSNNVIRQISSNCIPANDPFIKSITGSFTVCENEPQFVLYVDNNQSDLNDNLNWEWYKDDCGVTLLETGDTIEIYDSSYEQVYVISAGGCNSVSNCIKVNLTYLPNCDTLNDSGFEPIIYTAFSPNNDGDNDIWIIEGIDSVLQNKVYIYSRWGDLVYFTENYDNINNVWEGLNQTTKERVTVGTFFYIIESNEQRVASGWVQVIR